MGEGSSAMVHGARDLAALGGWGGREVGAGGRYREESRRVRAADLAGDCARDAVIESAAHLREDARLGSVRIDHDVIDCDGHVGLLVEALEQSRARRVAAPRGATEETEHRVDREQRLRFASIWFCIFSSMKVMEVDVMIRCS